ncbi:PX-SNX8-Mvp1p-like protein (macronuclear) [Tetrahymena thermophila SB210]|uniref:PX-SNX8-Mvp1p-like protein n=1 Tax=Tetrahymena thermophila (strain SB210) TaxID=312017 RepID=I7M328_TETTS|nr:PX-SNX8-Mvp1p-like protein [Tetrahymena thermophila SB210]EAS02031.1 PX-SNX8-Mvp1p-like protein [Tetrahymena thermophila SB210]|eukprot:XP_001022276.1 PX-SNX8-Mvp1p-like protein [Tetrahymena thermophila SB210]
MENIEDNQPRQLFSDKQGNIEQDNFQITVHVVDPIVKKEGVSQHVVYTVKGEDKLGTFEVIRRFSDFDGLRTYLQKRWPSCYIPPIPDKKSVGNMDQKFIEDRRNLLEAFVVKITELKHLWYSEEFQLFIRGTQSDVEKSLSKLPAQNNQELIQKYSNAFMYLSGKEINPSIEGKIDSFTQYLKKIGSLLTNYKEFAKNTLELREKDNKQYELFISYLLPEYEKNCFTEYIGAANDGKLIFAQNTDQKLSQLISQVKEFVSKDELNSLYQLIRQECKEIKAFTECMDSRKAFKESKENLHKKHRELKSEESKIISGKTSFKNVFSKKSKEENAQEIKQQIENTEAEISRASEIYDIMTVVLGYVEIDRFKAEKEALYFTTVKKLAKYELEFSKLRTEFWSYILENHNLSSI